MKKLIEVEIPFSGFYESIHDSQIDGALEQCFSDDYGDISEVDADAIYMADVDWKAIQAEYCNEYVIALAGITGLDFEYTEFTSPKYYNFSTDRLFATLPASQLNKLVREVKKYDNYADAIKERFTSYDGFMSFYSNDINHADWNKKEYDQCQYEVFIDLYIDHNFGNITNWVLDNINVYEFGSIWDAYEVVQKYKKDNGLEQPPSESDLQKDNGLEQLTIKEQ